MKKLLLSATIALGAIFSTAAQGYYNLNFTNSPGNPGGINTDFDFTLTSSVNPPSGTTKILGYSKNTSYSALETLPFPFSFNGGPVTNYYANTGGYISFSKIATAKNAGSTPAVLPSALLPDSSVCAWGLTTAPLSEATGEVYTKVYGTAPHRQLWVVWFACTNPADTCSMNWWGIVLEETTNNIYMVDDGAAYYWNTCGSYTAWGLTLGIQVNGTTAYQVAGSVMTSENNTSGGGNSTNNYYEFVPGTAPAYDASVLSSNIVGGSIYYGVGIPYPVSGTVANLGTTALTSLRINYSVDGGAAVNSVAAVSIAAPNSVSTGVATCTVPWTPATAGVHSMRIWADQLNTSNTDQNHSNDTLYINGINVIDSIQTKMVLLEEFMQASCDPCMYAAPNLDSVLTNNQAYCIPMRYHVSWPGNDHMNKSTWFPFDSERTFYYYGVSGVPDARLDGSEDIYPGSIASSDIQNEAAMGSPFKISITNCTYNTTTNVYNIQASIKAYGAFSAGLGADAVLTVDTIKYALDQSTEDPPSSFPGTNPQSYYQYVVNFPQVIEELMTGETGKSLGAFTAYQTQTINVSWTKNHPWGNDRAAWKYDSLFPGDHITVFVQDNTNQYVYQAATAPVTVITGMEEIASGVYFELYPNPTNNIANVAFKLEKEQNVTVAVYNMLGENVFSTNEGKMAAGQHNIEINGSGFQNGVYFVRFNTDNVTTTKKLIIQK